MTLTPAYGRDYKTAKAATEDFESNKDFIIADIGSKDCGRYCNKEQLIGEERQVKLRYDNLRKACVINVQQER